MALVMLRSIVLGRQRNTNKWLGVISHLLHIFFVVLSSSHLQKQSPCVRNLMPLITVKNWADCRFAETARPLVHVSSALKEDPTLPEFFTEPSDLEAALKVAAQLRAVEKGTGRAPSHTCA